MVASSSIPARYLDGRTCSCWRSQPPCSPQSLSHSHSLTHCPSPPCISWTTLSHQAKDGADWDEQLRTLQDGQVTIIDQLGEMREQMSLLTSTMMERLVVPPTAASGSPKDTCAPAYNRGPPPAYASAAHTPPSPPAAVDVVHGCQTAAPPQAQVPAAAHPPTPTYCPVYYVLAPASGWRIDHTPNNCTCFV